MAEQHSLQDEHNGTEYFKYKKHEADAFKNLFPGVPYRTWTLKKLRLAAEQVIPSLDKKQRNTVIDHLKQSLLSRQKHSLRFRYAPLRERHGHGFWFQLIQHIVDISNSEVAEQELNEELGDADVSVNNADFSRFLEDVELCVAQAEALWRIVKVGEMHLSTAATRLYPLQRLVFTDLIIEVTNTYLCTAITMINAEMLLNPSWFIEDRLAVSLLGVKSIYWTELKDCITYIHNTLLRAV
jgi:hypothetical protein